MTTPPKDEIIAWAHEAKVPTVVTNEIVIAFAHLCRADLVAENANVKALRDAWQKEAQELLAERDALKADAERLRTALKEYMSAFGQALESNQIAFGTQQVEADKHAREAIDMKQGEA